MAPGELRTYQLHGVTIASAYALDAQPAPADASPDYTVLRGPRREAGGRPDPAEDGRLIAELEMDGFAYWLAERPDGSWLMRYRDLADFEIDGSEITVHLAPESPEGFAPILIAGGVIARILSDRALLVLHASAVELDGRAVALLGGSGAGKSTTAAYLCLAGVPLFTDDTLAVRLADPSPGTGADAPPRCYPGTGTVRLRPAALPRLGPEIGAWISGSSADERLIARPPLSRHEQLELAAAVVLQRREGPGELSLTRLGGREAAIGLLRNPRSIGWQEPARLRAEFEAITRLAASIAVLEVSVPERLLGPELGAELIALLREAL